MDKPQVGELWFHKYETGKIILILETGIHANLDSATFKVSPSILEKCRVRRLGTHSSRLMEGRMSTHMILKYYVPHRTETQTQTDKK